jgi:hypothetical protein
MELEGSRHCELTPEEVPTVFVRVTLTLAIDEGDPESVNCWLYVKALPYCAEPAVVYQAEKSVAAGTITVF